MWPLTIQWVHMCCLGISRSKVSIVTGASSLCTEVWWESVTASIVCFGGREASNYCLLARYLPLSHECYLPLSHPTSVAYC
jgi:hypothetical protein